MSKHCIMRLAAGVLMAIMAVSCMPQPQLTPTPTKTPFPAILSSSSSGAAMGPTIITYTPSPAPVTPTATFTPSATLYQPTATDTQAFTPTATPTETPSEPTWTPPPVITTLHPDHYYLQRPIPEGYTNWANRTYAYGSTAGGQYRTHHAIDIENSYGTPVVAVANGEVVYTGDDCSVIFGPQPCFYGYLIVIQVDQTYDGQPIFVLYGHLGAIGVEVGQQVAQGDEIGEVGGSGVANGPHLHFEVRIGDAYDYGTTRNPDLWIRPWYEYGTLAGLVTDLSETPLVNVSISVIGEGSTRYTWTYADDSVNPDDEWQENFSLGDLPEGYYTVVIRASRTYREEIFIHPRQTNWVEFVLEQ